MATKIVIQQLNTIDSGSVNVGKYPRYVVRLGNSISSITAAELSTAVTAAQNSATAAAGSATNAATSASAALVSQNAAKTSETNAKTSETNANTSKNAAATSAAAALVSQNAAKTSETNSKTSETNSKTSETNSKTSETNAAASAAAALASKNAAATSETNAAQSAAAALASKNAAATSETNAKTSETNAKTSETNAAQSATDAASAVTGSLKINNNLSDLNNAATARTNLGLGTSATQNTGTSGANIPLLNGTNTWSGVQTFVGRTFITNLASTAAGTYNGTANVSQGVTGTLPITNGGTGAVTALAAAQAISAVPIMTTFSDVDVNTILTAGIYSVTAIAPNIPAAVTGTMEVYVRQGGIAITQIFHCNSTLTAYLNRHYIRTGSTSGGVTTWSDWVSLNQLTTNIVQGTDLNTLVTPGRYYGSFVNSPTGTGNSASAMVDVTSTLTGGVTIQSLYFTTANIVYTRTYNGSVWSAWSMSYSSTNKPAATDVGALPITGGTLTGATGLTTTGPVTSRENIVTYRQLLSRSDAFSPYTGYNRVDQVDGTLPASQTSIGDISARLTTTGGDPWGRTLGGMGMYYDTTGGGSTLVYARNAAGTLTSTITFAGDTGIATMRGALVANAITATTGTFSGLVSSSGPDTLGFNANRTGSASNSFYGAQTTAGQVFFGTATGTNFVVNNTQDSVAPWLTVSATSAAFIGSISAASLSLTTALPLASGGTGGTSKATAWAAIATYGTTAGTAAEGSDSRLNTVGGKTGGTISSTVSVTAGSTLGVAAWQTTSNNYIRLGNTNNDATSGNFVNSISGGYYTGNWSLGGVRGAGTDLNKVQLNILATSGGSSAGFLFFPDGRMQANQYIGLAGRVISFTGVQSTYLEILVDGNAKGINFFDSDETLKENIQDASGSKAISIIEGVRPVSYKFKDYKYNTTDSDGVEVEMVQPGGKHQFGVIAQEFEQLLPEGIITHGDGKKALDPLEILGLLLTTCHEQQKMIRELQADVAALKSS